MPPGWGKPRDIAKYTSVDRRVVYGWMKDGLPFARLPSRRVLIKFSDVDDFLARFRMDEKSSGQDLQKIASDVLEKAGLG